MKRSGRRGSIMVVFFIIMKNNENIVQWDEQGMKQFKGLLKQMYGEHGIGKFGNELDEHCTEITISQSTGESAKIEAKFNVD